MDLELASSGAHTCEECPSDGPLEELPTDR